MKSSIILAIVIIINSGLALAVIGVGGAILISPLATINSLSVEAREGASLSNDSDPGVQPSDTTMDLTQTTGVMDQATSPSPKSDPVNQGKSVIEANPTSNDTRSDLLSTPIIDLPPGDGKGVPAEVWMDMLFTNNTDNFIKVIGGKGDSDGGERSVHINAVGMRKTLNDSKLRKSAPLWSAIIEKAYSDGADKVKTAKDFENYMQGLAASDENIESIDMLTSQVVIRYFNHGKLFGFIPVRFMSVNTVDWSGSTTGRVKVRFPWYSFLMKKGVTAPEIEADISDVLYSSGDLDGSGNIVGIYREPEPSSYRKNGGVVAANFDYSAYAEMFNTLTNVLKQKTVVF